MVILIMNKNLPKWAKELQLFFKDIENGIYGERIKEIFNEKESSE